MTPELKTAIANMKDAIFDLGVKVPDKKNPRIAEVLFSPQVKVVMDRFVDLVDQIKREDQQCIKTTSK